MNIFILDYDYQKAVEAHCDKHVVKMCLEHAQLLCSVHHVTGSFDPSFMYKLTHKNHPCAVWARENSANYNWLYDMTIALGEEYTFRYGKFHKSIETVVKMLPQPTLPDGDLTPHAKCVADDLKSIPDVVDAYRAYYNRDKAYMCKWTLRDEPDWFIRPLS